MATKNEMEMEARSQTSPPSTCRLRNRHILQLFTRRQYGNSAQKCMGKYLAKNSNVSTYVSAVVAALRLVALSVAVSITWRERDEGVTTQTRQNGVEKTKSVHRADENSRQHSVSATTAHEALSADVFWRVGRNKMKQNKCWMSFTGTPSRSNIIHAMSVDTNRKK